MLLDFLGVPPNDIILQSPIEITTELIDSPEYFAKFLDGFFFLSPLDYNANGVRLREFAVVHMRDIDVPKFWNQVAKLSGEFFSIETLFPISRFRGKIGGSDFSIGNFHTNPPSEKGANLGCSALDDLIR